MRSVVLNMIIMGAIGCLVEDAVGMQHVFNSYRSSRDNANYDSGPSKKSQSQNASNDSSDESDTEDEESADEKPYWFRSMKNTSKSQKQRSKTRRDSGFAENSSRANIPTPPPPPAGGMGVPPPPPPGMAGAVVQSVDVSEYLKEHKKYLNTFLKDNEIRQFAKIINLRLKGNKQEISEGISNCEKNVIQLRSWLSESLKELEISEDQDVLHICRTLRNLDFHLNMLTYKSYASAENRVKTFGTLRDIIEGIACEYFEIIKKSANKLKAVPYLKTLKTTQNVVERALVLSQSFYDLVRLSIQEKVEFSDKEMKELCSLFKLKSVIPSRIADIEKREKDIKEAIAEQSQEIPENIEITIKLPTGKILRERDCLARVLDLINKIFEGEHQLEKLFKLKQLLNNKYSEITIPAKGIASLVDPINILIKMDDKVDTMRLLNQVENDFEVSSYTQIGPKYKVNEGDYGGGALIPSIVAYRELASLPAFKISDNIRRWIASKKMKGNSISEYIKLIVSFTNVSNDFTKNACDAIKSKSEVFELSSFRSKSNTISKQKSKQKEEKQVLLEIVKKDKKEKVLDLNDDLFFKSLLKNFDEYIVGILSIAEDLKMTSQIEKDSQDIFEEDGGNGAGYANCVLDSYLKFNSSSEDKGRIVVEMVGDNTLTEKDIPNILFAFAQHRDLIENSSMIIFPKSTDEDKARLLEIIKTLSNNLKLVINSMQTQNDNKELDVLIEKIENLRMSILTPEEIRAEYNKEDSENTANQGMLKLNTARNQKRFKSAANKVKNLKMATSKKVTVR